MASKFEIAGARLCAKRQPLRVEMAAAGLRYSRTPPIHDATGRSENLFLP
jgi:hypothetical protein